MEKHERLREARKRRYRTVAAAAEAMGVPKGTYGNHEAGSRDFGDDDARRYAKAFGVRLSWLVFESGPMDPEPAPRGRIMSLEEFERIAVPIIEGKDFPVDGDESVPVDGSLVKLLRRSRNLSLDSIAKKADLTEKFWAWLESDERRISIEDLEAIARALDVSPRRLISGLEFLPHSDAFGMARVDGRVQAGAFLEVEVFGDDGAEEYVSAPRDPDFPFARQVAWRVGGDSMNQADRPIRDGDIVIGAMFEDLGLELEDLDGEIVIVQQTIADGQLRERSLKELHWFPDRVEYRPRSSNPAHKPIVVPKNRDPDDTRVVEVIALHRFTFEGRPRPMRKRAPGSR